MFDVWNEFASIKLWVIKTWDIAKEIGSQFYLYNQLNKIFGWVFWYIVFDADRISKYWFSEVKPVLHVSVSISSQTVITHLSLWKVVVFHEPVEVKIETRSYRDSWSYIFAGWVCCYHQTFVVHIFWLTFKHVWYYQEIWTSKSTNGTGNTVGLFKFVSCSEAASMWSNLR